MKITVDNDGIGLTTPSFQETKKATINFDKNEITIGSEEGINIFSIEEKQQIEYQGNQYELTKEELLAIYLDIIIHKIEMKIH